MCVSTKVKYQLHTSHCCCYDILHAYRFVIESCLVIWFSTKKQTHKIQWCPKKFKTYKRHPKMKSAIEKQFEIAIHGFQMWFLYLKGIHQYLFQVTPELDSQLYLQSSIISKLILFWNTLYLDSVAKNLWYFTDHHCNNTSHRCHTHGDLI